MKNPASAPTLPGSGINNLAQYFYMNAANTASHSHKPNYFGQLGQTPTCSPPPCAMLAAVRAASIFWVTANVYLPICITGADYFKHNKSNFERLYGRENPAVWEDTAEETRRAYYALAICRLRNEAMRNDSTRHSLIFIRRTRPFQLLAKNLYNRDRKRLVEYRAVLDSKSLLTVDATKTPYQ